MQRAEFTVRPGCVQRLKPLFKSFSLSRPSAIA